VSVDPDVIQRVAELAKLNLGPDERGELARQLTRVLEFVAQLDEVDVSEVVPTKHVIGLDNVGRPDEPRPSLTQEAALAEAPEADEGHFVVPKVLPD
jgi:aspartyl-tRNA(Asn)/glutamyl-tRNA(Gln) amidotransferase subunit C